MTGPGHNSGPAGMSVADLLALFDREEIWRRISGYPGYEVSSWGGVRGPRGTLAPVQSGDYQIVSIGDGQVWRTARVHKLVVDAFLGDPPFDGAIAAHNDGDSCNNRASNLRWTTPLDNQADRDRHGTRIRGSEVFGAKLHEDDIPLIRRRIAAGERYKTIAEDFGVSISTISLIKRDAIWRSVTPEQRAAA